MSDGEKQLDEQVEESANLDATENSVDENPASDEPQIDLAAEAAQVLDEAETAETNTDAALQEANNRVLRAQAELENFRKRMRREMDEERKYAALPLLTDLLSVVDNLKRAIDAASQTESGSGLLDGVQMVAGMLDSVMAKHNCVPIEAQGQPFDPHFHEAIAQIPSADVEPGTVIEVAVGGYKLHDRVVRAPQVVVSAAPPAPVPESPPAEESDS